MKPKLAAAKRERSMAATSWTWRIGVLTAVLAGTRLAQADEPGEQTQLAAHRRYAFSYFPRYPYSYFRRYPFGYYQGGSRYPFGYPYSSYGSYGAYASRPYPYGLHGLYGSASGPGFGSLPPIHGPEPWEERESPEAVLPLLDRLAEAPLMPVPIPQDIEEQPQAGRVAPPVREGPAAGQPLRTMPGPLLVRPYTGLWLGDRPAERRRLYGP